jgi:hypothetical protein
MMESVGTALRATARVARTRRRGGDAVRLLVRATLAVALQATSSPYVRTYGACPHPLALLTSGPDGAIPSGLGCMGNN